MQRTNVTSALGSSSATRNVRTCVRIRPSAPGDADRCVAVTTATEGHAIVSLAAEAVAPFPKIFTVEHCYDAEFNNSKFYAEAIAPAVNGAVPGDTLCFLAYGHTSSGKTHTILGSAGDGGVLPRLAADLLRFDTGSGVEVTFLEIYNERVFDLLAEGQECRVRRRGPKGAAFVEGLTRVAVATEDDWELVCACGLQRRRSASTVANERSSRSHAMFTLRAPHLTVCLVDLAGSERQDLFSAALSKESIAINMSLSKLSTVIEALSRSGGANAGGGASLVGLGGDDDIEGRPTPRSSSGGPKTGASVRISASQLRQQQQQQQPLSRAPLRSASTNSTMSTTAGAKSLPLSRSASINSAVTASPTSPLSAGGPGTPAPFINYRDTVLTVLLQRYLEGSSLTTFIACVHPSDRFMLESANTLRYISKLKRINTRCLLAQAMGGGAAGGSAGAGAAHQLQQRLIAERERELRERLEATMRALEEHKQVAAHIHRAQQERIEELEERHTQLVTAGQSVLVSSASNSMLMVTPSHADALNASGAALSETVVRRQQWLDTRARTAKRVAGWLLAAAAARRSSGIAPDAFSIMCDEAFDAAFPNFDVLGYATSLQVPPTIDWAAASSADAETVFATLDVGDTAMGASMLGVGIPPLVDLHRLPSCRAAGADFDSHPWEDGDVFVMAVFELDAALARPSTAQLGGCCEALVASEPLVPLAVVFMVEAGDAASDDLRRSVVRYLVELQAYQDRVAASSAAPADAARVESDITVVAAASLFGHQHDVADPSPVAATTRSANCSTHTVNMSAAAGEGEDASVVEERAKCDVSILNEKASTVATPPTLVAPTSAQRLVVAQGVSIRTPPPPAADDDGVLLESVNLGLKPMDEDPSTAAASDSTFMTTTDEGPDTTPQRPLVAPARAPPQPQIRRVQQPLHRSTRSVVAGAATKVNTQRRAEASQQRTPRASPMCGECMLM